MLERTAAQAIGETRRRLYAHYDYFGYIIPALWFIIGTVVSTYVITGGFPKTIDSLVETLPSRTTPGSVPFDIMIVLVALLLLFNVVYITGHMINGASALLLDRYVVKKFLRYPFKLYSLKMSRRLGKDLYKFGENEDHEVFSRAMLCSSYLVAASVNLLPVVAIESALVLYFERYPERWFRPEDGFLLVGFVLVAIVLHLGVPTSRPSLKLRSSPGTSTDKFRTYRRVHLWFICLCTITLSVWCSFENNVTPVLLLLVVNGIWTGVDRHTEQTLEQASLGKETRDKGYEAWDALYQEMLVGSDKVKVRLAWYVRATAVSWLSAVAHLVDFGEMPSAETLRKTFSRIKTEDWRSSDSYWLAFVNVENLAPRSFPAAYHFLSMYGMNRNLCMSTIGILSVASVEWFMTSAGERVRPDYALVWIVCAALVAGVFFVRYLYIFSGYFSKYIARVAAFLDSVEERDVGWRGKIGTMDLHLTKVERESPVE